MEHKDLWLVIGLTVILAVAVTVSTVSMTGNAISWGFGKIPTSTATQANLPSTVVTTPWRFSCVFRSASDGITLAGKTPADLCSSLSNKMVPISLEKRYTYLYYSTKDCTGKVLFEDRDTASLNVAGTRSNTELGVEAVGCATDIGGYYTVIAVPSGVLCCEVLSNT